MNIYLLMGNKINSHLSYHTYHAYLSYHISLSCRLSYPSYHLSCPSCHPSYASCLSCQYSLYHTQMIPKNICPSNL